MLILITGPQGSGKTQEAYRLRSLLNNQTSLVFDECPPERLFYLCDEDVLFITMNTEPPEWVMKYPNLIHFTMPAR